MIQEYNRIDNVHNKIVSPISDNRMQLSKLGGYPIIQDNTYPISKLDVGVEIRD